MTTKSFQQLETNDIVTRRKLLHESIPITGSILSGTYGDTNTAAEFPNENNIKNFSHGIYQSVYDYPYLSSSANHLFDITMGYSTSSVWNHNNEPVAEGENTQNAAKVNMYNQMAQVLMGHDHTGSIKDFQIPGGDLIREAYFINFSRLLVKDEIKKGSFAIQFGTGSQFNAAHNFNGTARKLVDYGATTYYTDSPSGDYAILSMSVDPPAPELGGKPAGLIFYQAGVIVLSSSMFYPYDPTNLESGTSATATLMSGNPLPSSGDLEGKTIILTNTDGTSVTWTFSDGATNSATAINGSNASTAALATNVKAALDAAVTAGTLKMTVSAITANNTGELTVITLTQNTTGARGNKSITGTAIDADYVLCNQTTKGGAQGTEAFTGGHGDHDNDNYLAMTGSAIGHTKSDDDLSFRHLLVSSSISGTANALRHRIDNIEFQNTTKLNSTIHFCRFNSNQLNYSSNPTYLSESKIQVKTVANDLPHSYVTTVGLYGSDNGLLAVAKLSRPLKKTPNDEFILKVRLDY